MMEDSNEVFRRYENFLARCLEYVAHHNAVNYSGERPSALQMAVLKSIDAQMRGEAQSLVNVLHAQATIAGGIQTATKLFEAAPPWLAAAVLFNSKVLRKR